MIHTNKSKVHAYVHNRLPPTISPEWNFTCVIYHQTYRYSITNDVKTPPSSFKSILTLDQSYRKSCACVALDTLVNVSTQFPRQFPFSRRFEIVQKRIHLSLLKRKKEIFSLLHPPPPPSFLEERNHRFSSNFLQPKFSFRHPRFKDSIFPPLRRIRRFAVSTTIIPPRPSAISTEIRQSMLSHESVNRISHVEFPSRSPPKSYLTQPHVEIVIDRAASAVTHKPERAATQDLTMIRAKIRSGNVGPFECIRVENRGMRGIFHGIPFSLSLTFFFFF